MSSSYPIAGNQHFTGVENVAGQVAHLDVAELTTAHVNNAPTEYTIRGYSPVTAPGGSSALVGLTVNHAVSLMRAPGLHLQRDALRIPSNTLVKQITAYRGDEQLAGAAGAKLTVFLSDAFLTLPSMAGGANAARTLLDDVDFRHLNATTDTVSGNFVAQHLGGVLANAVGLAAGTDPLSAPQTLGTPGQAPGLNGMLIVGAGPQREAAFVGAEVRAAELTAGNLVVDITLVAFPEFKKADIP